MTAVSRQLPLVLTGSLLLGSLELAGAQAAGKRHPSGKLSGEYQWTEGGRKSSDSFTLDEGSCVAFLTFFPDGGLRFSYLYNRVSSQTWDYSHRRPGSTRFRKTERRTTDYSGRLVIPSNPPANRADTLSVVAGPYVDSIPGYLQLATKPDGSLDLDYDYPPRIPALSKTEVINTEWGGRVNTVVEQDWHPITTRCEPYVYVWSQQRALRSTQGNLAGLAGSVGPTQLPRTNRWITLRWNLLAP